MTNFLSNEKMDNSTLTKMQLHYWEAKQTFLKKVKRKEDDCVVASDAELDAKLEVSKQLAGNRPKLTPDSGVDLASQVN